MNRRLVLALLLGGALLWWYSDRPARKRPDPAPPAKPKPKLPEPKKPRRPCPGPGPCPLESKEAGGRPAEGGRVSPDGAVEVVCDLPASERKKNIASKGLGCCVFRSIDYAAHWQQVPELYDLPEKLVKAGIPGRPAAGDDDAQGRHRSNRQSGRGSRRQTGHRRHQKCRRPPTTEIKNFNHGSHG